MSAPLQDVGSPTAATYVYCLARGAEPPDLGGAPVGLPGATTPRAVAAGPDLWLVAASVPLPAYGATAIETGLLDLDWVGERALAHEAVVEHVTRTRPVVPAKLFTLFHDDARAAAELGRRRDELAAVFERLAGRREWGVRVHFDGSRLDAARSAGPAASGRDYLRRKQQERDLPRRLAAEARAAAATLFDLLASRAVAAIRKPAAGPTGALLLDATLLVDQDRESELEELVAAEGRRLGASAAILVTPSGTLPPANFFAATA